jgi:hypothetical protein
LPFDELTMSEENKKSLVTRYYKWELSVLITSLLLIFWQIFGLNDATSLPLLDVKLRDPSKFPLVTSSAKATTRCRNRTAGF